MNPLFDKPAQAPAVVPAATTSEFKKPTVVPHFKVTPLSSSKIKLRGFSPSPIPQAPLVDTSGAMKPAVADVMFFVIVREFQNQDS